MELALVLVLLVFVDTFLTGYLLASLLRMRREWREVERPRVRRAHVVLAPDSDEEVVEV